MGRVLHGIEKGLKIYLENSDTSVDILAGSAAPVGTGDQAAAAIGSLYLRIGTGELYQKIANAAAPSDWELNGSSSATIGNWRPEYLAAVTSEDVGAGVRDLVASPFTDDDGTTLVAADFVAGQYIIDDSAGSPQLLEITLVDGDEITLVASSNPLVANDTFVAQHYLPDSPDAQEGKAIVNYNGSIIVKLSDIDWNFADGINMAAGYAAGNGSVSSSDSVNSAIQKLDGNQQDIQAASGLAQGDVDYGSFTGTTIPDNSTSKEALQALESSVESKADSSTVSEIDANVDDLITLSGVAENSTDLGTFTGATIPDASTNKGALQALETAHEETDANVDDLIALSGVAENATDLGTFTGDIIPDASDNKEALQALESELVDTRDNADSLIALSGVAENAENFGAFSGLSLADDQTAKQLFQRIEVLLEQMRGVQVAGITTATPVDSVPTASVKACKWLVEVFEVATPANRQAFEVYALNDGTLVDNTVYSKLKLGSNFNLTLSVDINAGNMRLVAASTSGGVTVTARRIEVVKSVL